MRRMPTRRSRPGRSLSAADAADRLGGDLEPATALAAHIAAVRELFEEAGVLLADVGRRASDLGRARGRASCGGGRLRGDRGRARPAASDRPARAAVALGDAAGHAAAVRRAVLRGGAAAGAAVPGRGDEVAGHGWHRRSPRLIDGGGRLGMWVPTTTTLQQLEHVRSIDESRQRLAPGRLGGRRRRAWPRRDPIVMPAGGGVAGQPVLPTSSVAAASSSSTRATRRARPSIARSSWPRRGRARSTPWR